MFFCVVYLYRNICYQFMNFLQLKFRLLLPRESVRIKLWFLENEPHKTHWEEHPYHVTALL